MKQTDIQNKFRKKFLNQGVKMTAPETVFFSNDTRIGKNVTIEPYVVFGSKVKIKNNVSGIKFAKTKNKLKPEAIKETPIRIIRLSILSDKYPIGH